MKHLICLSLFIFSWNLGLFSDSQPIKFVTFITTYNNEKWCIENLESCLNQTYRNFIIICVDDCSTDKTGLLIDDYVKSHHLQNKVIVIHNKKRVRGLVNYYTVINSLPPECVVVNVDGDDKLMHCYVLEKLAKIYKDPNIWLTYGDLAPDDPSFTYHSEPFPPDVIRNKSYRSYLFVSSHLRTFYAGLFQHIRKEDFLYHDGNFFPRVPDTVFMFPMLEMASPNHFKFIPEALYWYRTTNPLSEIHLHLELTEQCLAEVRSKKPYPSLDVLFPDMTKSNSKTE
jgi:glycosyltransferase involved in cell wall biosynthesis